MPAQRKLYEPPPIDDFQVEPEQTPNMAALAADLSKPLPSANLDDLEITDPTTPTALKRDDAAPVATPAPSSVDTGKPPASAFAKLSQMTLSTPSYDDTADRTAIAAGADRDRQTNLLRGIEMAGKQFNAAMGGTDVAPTFLTPTTYEKDARAVASHNADKAMQRGLAQKQFEATQEQRRIAQAHQQWLEEQKLKDQDRQAKEDEARHTQTATSNDLRAKAIAASEHNAQAMQALANERLGISKEELDVKKGEIARKQTEGLPAGYEVVAGGQPSQSQREDAAKIIASAKGMNSSIDELEKYLTKTPKTTLLNPASNERRRIAQILQEIGTNVRVAENLGVPSGADTKITKDLQGDPENALSIVLGQGPAAIAELRRYSKGKVNDKLGTYGIAPAGTGVGTATAKSSLKPGRYATKDGRTVVVDENGNKRFE